MSALLWMHSHQTLDADGLQATKTVNGEEHTYIYNGGKLTLEKYGTKLIEYLYTPDGQPYSLRYLQDGPTHVSVRPAGATTEGWINAGSGSIWTQAVQSVVIKWDGGY